MPESFSFNPHGTRLPAWIDADEARSLGLPIDLLQEVPRRLTLLAVVVIAIGIAGELIALFTSPEFNPALRYASTGFLIVAASIVLAFSTRPRLSGRQFLNLAVLFELLWAASEALATAELAWSTTDRIAVTWSSVAVIVLIYPIVVPNTTGRTILASVVAAGTEPLAVVLLSRWGLVTVPSSAEVWIQHVTPNAFAVLLAIVVSRIMYRLGQRLTRARAVGSYTLEKRLGKGGMGEVWLASHGMLARKAAIKLIRRDAVGGLDRAAADQQIKRFEREAQATASLRSPHTVEIYDFGTTTDGTFYYVMELLDGLDFSTLVERHGPQPPERVTRLLQQACSSLHEAHLQGMVHRDIKPHNLFLCRYGVTLDFVKVLDFGLVKHVGPSSASEENLTREGFVSGTPAFISPEAVLGNGALDGRADIYGIGCVAYWLLTGKPPFDRQTPLAMAEAHATAAPRAIRSLNPDVPADLEGIIMRCLAKQPGDRPGDAKTLSDMLGGLDISRLWTVERADEWWQEKQRSDIEG